MEQKTEEPGQVSLFSETMLPEYSLFSVINRQKKLTPPLEQLGNSSRTPTSTESAISQPLALPSPSEPSRISATASLFTQRHIDRTLDKKNKISPRKDYYLDSDF